jgi:predicted aldo/keto reductase-like oxidoreductase
MDYRALGMTDKEVSVIGLGCEHLDGKPYSQVEDTVREALSHGVNIFDVFMPGAKVRHNIAKALGERRKNVMVQGHIGSTDIKQQYDISRGMDDVKRYFEELLEIFGGYIDFGMLFFIDSKEDYNNVFETDFVKYAQEMKKCGHIRHIGFSSHSPEIATMAINTGVPEMMMFSINPAFDMLPPQEYIITQLEKPLIDGSLFRGIDPKRADLYKLCSQKGIGITVMKTLGGGKLISKEFSPFEKPLDVPQCIHYALSRPAVASALVGCKTPDEVGQAMEYFKMDDSQKDFTGIINSIRNDFMGNCVYCNHCQPCPQEIDIAAVNKYLDIARLDLENISPSTRAHYAALAYSGGKCSDCGSCEARCPFGVPVAANMREAESLLR